MYKTVFGKTDLVLKTHGAWKTFWDITEAAAAHAELVKYGLVVYNAKCYFIFWEYISQLNVSFFRAQLAWMRAKAAAKALKEVPLGTHFQIPQYIYTHSGFSLSIKMSGL